MLKPSEFPSTFEALIAWPPAFIVTSTCPTLGHLPELSAMLQVQAALQVTPAG